MDTEKIAHGVLILLFLGAMGALVIGRVEIFSFLFACEIGFMITTGLVVLWNE